MPPLFIWVEHAVVPLYHWYVYGSDPPVGLEFNVILWPSSIIGLLGVIGFASNEPVGAIVNDDEILSLE